MTDAERTEIRNFFGAVEGLRTACREGRPTGEYLDELEGIALHSEQPVLRLRAQSILNDARRPAVAIG